MNADRSPAPRSFNLFNHKWVFWIFLIVSLTYAPFLGFRGIRMAGDEKVYVSQAIEMAQQGHWFLQILQDVPDYYKGPLHYILLRIGMMIFGWNPWAVLYMNFLLVLGGACALGALIRRYCGGVKADGLAVFTGAFFATCTGVYAHTFASQMEAELAGLFAITFYVLDSTPLDAGGFLFWALAGSIGWSKSPLHAVFVGISAILFWVANGELIPRAKNWKSWAAAFFGISVCVAGYMPAFLLDRENFVQIYIYRETLSKGDSGQSWTISFQSVLGFYLFPWMLLAFVSYFDFAAKMVRPWKYFFDPGTRRALWLSFCGVLPSFLFFAWHPYHFENYDLPVISGVILFVGTALGTGVSASGEPNRSPVAERFYRIAIGMTAIVILFLPIGLTALEHRFAPRPPWWPQSLVSIAWVGTLIAVAGLIYFGVLGKFRKLEWLSVSMVGFLFALGSTVTVIGERELYDLRQFLLTPQGHQVQTIGYYNLQRNIWSEWGLLNFWVNRKFVSLHEPEALKNALSSGQLVLVPSKSPQQDFRDFVKKELPGLRLEMLPWKRWRTQGKSESGEPLWKDAWRKKDISVLETDYLIVFKKPNIHEF